ncbi:MFS transporter [Megamonas hypermegale]|uniref:MFS transporter n=1 Tax=Megamonas hypermegale TaxID=158847 RepID=A0A921HPQ6_9FIRM|nr:MFS transporter [Megamonas hypermegale]MDM8142486.1 MFS transporter [Megamonas hypermegale]HJF85308.1 MFS transporter [Megamonas hypermegale]
MSWKAILAILTCNVVLMSASYTMLIPFLPMYLIQELGVPADHANMWSGVVFSISFIVSAVMGPIWGKLSDKKGRKLMAIRSGAGLAIAYFLCGIVSSPFQLMLARAFQGFAAGLWPAELAIMSAYAPKQKLGFCMGVMQGALTAGGVIGPLLGGVLASVFGMRVSFFIAAAALGIITLITFIFIKEPPRAEQTPEQILVAQKAEQVNLLKIPMIRRLLECAVVIQMAILILQPILTIYIAELNHSMENVVMLSGIVFSLGGFAGAISSPLWGKYGQKHGFFRTMCITLAISGIVLILQAIPDTLIPFAVLQFMCGLFYAGVYPSINSILVKKSPPEQRGRIFGLMFSAQQVGSTIGPLVGGIIGTFIGLKFVFIFAGALMFLTSASMYLKPPIRKPQRKFIH